LKYLPGRGALFALLVALATPAALLAAASLPWRAEVRDEPPRVVRAAAGSGALQAGAGLAPFALPADVPIAGYARLRYGSEAPAGPVGARALVLAAPGCKVALVSAELLLVPEPLERAVAARVADLGLDGLVLAATHTHAGPGGFWDHALGERIATGPYDARVAEAIASAIAEAIRAADGDLAPARAAVLRGGAAELARSRSGGAVEGRLAVLRLDRPDGAPVGELAVFAAHPTILGKANRRISGDWPGGFMAAGAGIRLFFEGALGDQSVEGEAAGTPEAFAVALSARVDALGGEAPDPSPALGYAAVEVPLPAADPGAVPPLLRRAARNLAGGLVPRTAIVEAVRIGDALLVATPAEPVASVAAAWRAALPEGAEIVSLSGGYLGYVEAPERMAARSGETIRTYFGPSLAARLADGLRLAAETASGAPRAAGAPRAPAPGATARPAAAP
jgi:neutral ceramidase